jgi:hypothetical protein
MRAGELTPGEADEPASLKIAYPSYFGDVRLFNSMGR